MPAALLLVAVFHLYGFFHHYRSSWGTGVAFGMFATADSHGTRWIVVDDAAGRRQVFDWDTSQSIPLVAKTLASPTPERVGRCAEFFASPVRLYGVRFDPGTWDLRSFEIAQATPRKVASEDGR